MTPKVFKDASTPTEAKPSRASSPDVIVNGDEVVPKKIGRILQNLPIPFRARYSKVVAIIDCLEIQIPVYLDGIPNQSSNLAVSSSNLAVLKNTS